jgi:hypothetical protein
VIFDFDQNVLAIRPFVPRALGECCNEKTVDMLYYSFL